MVSLRGRVACVQLSALVEGLDAWLSFQDSTHTGPQINVKQLNAKSSTSFGLHGSNVARLPKQGTKRGSSVLHMVSHWDEVDASHEDRRAVSMMPPAHSHQPSLIVR